MQTTTYREHGLVISCWGGLVIAQDMRGRIVEVGLDMDGRGGRGVITASSARKLQRVAVDRAAQKSRARARMSPEERLAVRAARERARYVAARPAPAPTPRPEKKKSPSALARELWSSRGRR